MGLISIVIRVEDQAENLIDLSGRLEKAASEIVRHNFEFIYVDNGSSDPSYRILQDLANADRRVRVVKLSKNFGGPAGVLAGIAYASGDGLAVIDGDLSAPLDVLGDMIARWEGGAKVVLAIRKEEGLLSRLPHVLTTLLNWLSRTLGFPVFSAKAGSFYLFDRLVAEALLQANGTGDSITGFLEWTGFRPGVVYFIPEQTEQSQPSLRSPAPNRRGITVLFRSSYLLLRLFARLGFLLAFIEAIMILAIVISGLGSGANLSEFIENYPTWNLVALFLMAPSAIQLTILGLIGEYLWRTLSPARLRPSFIVESVINEPLPNPEAREKIERILLSLTAGARRRKTGGLPHRG